MIISLNVDSCWKLWGIWESISRHQACWWRQSCAGPGNHKISGTLCSRCCSLTTSAIHGSCSLNQTLNAVLEMRFLVNRSYQVRSCTVQVTLSHLYSHPSIITQWWLTGNGQSIVSTVSDGIIHTWLGSTATWRWPLVYFNSTTEVVDNWPHKQW